MTDDHGQSTHPRPTSRPVTEDGRLEWVPWVIGNKSGHEFFLDGQNLGTITLEEAMKVYGEKQNAD